MSGSSIIAAATGRAPARELQRQRWREAGSYPNISVGQAISAAAAVAGSSRLVFASGERRDEVTLSELYERSRGVAAGLIALGVSPGDSVVVQAPSSIDSTAVVSALWLMGAVVIPVVTFATDDEVRIILARSGADTMVVPGEWRGTDYAARAIGLPVERIIVIDSGRPSPRWLTLEMIEASPPLAELPDVSPAAVACVIFTSGSTAEPKGVRHSSETLLAGMPLDTAGQAGMGVSLMAFPAGHSASLGGLLRPLVCGGTTVIMDRWSPAAAVALIEEHRVTFSAGTPFYLTTLLDEAERTGRDISSLTTYLVGAASVPPSLVERAERAGITAWRTYGSTEHPVISGGAPDDTVDRRTRTDGRIGPGNEVRIVDEHDADVPLGADGEILARGPKQFLGYTDPELDADAFADGSWFRTGDIGRLDADGYLTVTDRKKDIIIRGGENISAKEVEDALATHGAVAEVAVCAGPDLVWGEQVSAFVIPRAGRSCTLETLREHLVAGGLAAHKLPTSLDIVDDFPRTAAGKIRKIDLRATLRARVV